MRMNLMTAVAVAAMSCAAVANAGNLTPPPGAVMPSMKDLDTVEPRIPVGPTTTPGDASSTYVIAQSGSYYLTENLVGEPGKNGIHIMAPNVTLDLMGYSVIGVPTSAFSGIIADFFLDPVSVGNGIVRDWGFEGVTSASAGVFFDLIAINNAISGIAVFDGSIVERCLARDNGDFGIGFNGRGTAQSCSAWNNGGPGIGAGGVLVASNCFALGNEFRGFQGGFGSALINCFALSNPSDGFILGDGSTVVGCTARLNIGTGFILIGPGAIVSCLADQNSSSGFVVEAGSSLTGCSATQNGNFGFFSVPFAPARHGGTFAHCTAWDNGIDGFCAGPNSTIVACSSGDNTADGFFAMEGSAIRDCTAFGNGDDGISVGAGCSVIGNTMRSNSFGIFTTGDGCRVEENTVEASTFTGYLLSGSDHLIVKNLARQNSTDYSITIGANQVGPINTTFGTILSEHPWANFGGTTLTSQVVTMVDPTLIKARQQEPARSARPRPQLVEVAQ